MPGGLIALLDDVAALTKLAASSLDDVAAAAGRAGTKSAGVVIDDAAVTPSYVVGLSPDREVPIIAKIAVGSLRNKLLFILPVALALSALAPWLITPILMLGGTYLCFEGAEKVWEKLSGAHHADEVIEITDPKALEARQVGGAIRTDFILSAEIMAIALADLTGRSIGTQAAVLALVGIGITIAVYGVVALIVKMDDFGLYLAKRPGGTAQMLGRGLVRGMPALLRALSLIGTAAMVWVGGGIIIHGLAAFGFATIEHIVHDAAVAVGHAVPAIGGILEWLVTAIGSAIVGLAVGAVVVLVVSRFHHSGHGEAQVA
ncbi:MULTISPECIES: DUF808 domain-containing protein [unclassified Sphingomonas]|jgi:predicted DNA repair protein MutK|uniref:DUF808 domain-containing protein n=1 Tax=unclassified Sphingomonas TaxID=196159 RepID=UPI00082B853B|nr:MULTISPECIES: DUF808 domain-containing protein [unclassified Sphingomonas]